MRLLSPGAEAPPAEQAPPAEPEPGLAVGEGHVKSWTVQPGDCFWSFAEDMLASVWGRVPSDAEIVPYWRSLIEENRSSLADATNPRPHLSRSGLCGSAAAQRTPKEG